MTPHDEGMPQEGLQPGEVEVRPHARRRCTYIAYPRIGRRSPATSCRIPKNYSFIRRKRSYCPEMKQRT